MKKIIAAAAVLLFAFTSVYAADSGPAGVWKTIDEKSGLPKGLVVIYEYKGMLYGRLIASYNPDGTLKDDIYRKLRKAPFLKGDPAYCGMDIIWNMKKTDGKYALGKIMDPGSETEKPSIYDCELWLDGKTLTVRGKILFIGRNQTWQPFKPSDLPAGFQLPDPASFVPKIPELK